VEEEEEEEEGIEIGRQHLLLRGVSGPLIYSSTRTKVSSQNLELPKPNLIYYVKYGFLMP